MQQDSPASFQSLPEGPLRLIASKLSLRGKLALSLVCSDARRILVADPDPGCMGKLHVIVDPPNIIKSHLEGCRFKFKTMNASDADVRYGYPASSSTVVIRLSAAAAPDTRADIIQSVRRRLHSFASVVLEIAPADHLHSTEALRSYRTVFPVWAELIEGLRGLMFASNLAQPPVTVRQRVTDFPRDRSFLAPFLEPLSRLRGLKVAADVRIDQAVSGPFFDFEFEAISSFESLSNLSDVRLIVEAPRDFPALSCLSSLSSLHLIPYTGSSLFQSASSRAALAQLSGLKSLHVDEDLVAQFLTEPGVAATLSLLTALKTVSIDFSRPETLLPALQMFPYVTSLTLFSNELMSVEHAAMLGSIPERISAITFLFDIECSLSNSRRLHQCLLPSDALASLTNITSLTFQCLFHPPGFDALWEEPEQEQQAPPLVEYPEYGSPWPRIRFLPGPSLASLTKLKSLCFDTAFRCLHEYREIRHLPDVGFVLPSGFSALTALTSLRADGLSDFIDQDLPPQMRGEGRVRIQRKRASILALGFQPLADLTYLVDPLCPSLEVFSFGPDLDLGSGH